MLNQESHPESPLSDSKSRRTLPGLRFSLRTLVLIAIPVSAVMCLLAVRWLRISERRELRELLQSHGYYHPAFADSDSITDHFLDPVFHDEISESELLRRESRGENMLLSVRGMTVEDTVEDCKVLQRLPNVSRLHVFQDDRYNVTPGKRITIGELATLAPNLKHLHYSGRDFPSSEMTGIIKLNKLETLSISGNVAVDNASLEVISRLPNLRVLEAGYSKRYQDDWLIHIGKIRSLRELELNNSPISDDGLKRLTELKHLEELELRETKISDKGLQYLASMSKLRDLDLTKTNLTGQGFRYLVDLNDLQELDLEGTPVHLGGEFLGRFPNLRKINARDTDVDDQWVKQLCNCPSLQEIDLGGTKISDDAFEYLARLPNLRELYVDRTGVTDLAMEYLQRAPNLWRLNVAGTYVSRDGTDGICRQLTKRGISDPSVIRDWCAECFDARTGQRISGLPTVPAQFSADGKMAIGPNEWRDAKIFSFPKPGVLNQFSYRFADAAISPNGSIVYALRDSDSIREIPRTHQVFDARTKQMLHSETRENHRTWIAISPTNRLARIVGNRISIWSLPDCKELRSFAIDDGGRAKFSPDGGQIAMVSKSKVFGLWDLESKTRLAKEVNVLDFGFRDEGEPVLMIQDGEQAMTIRDLQNGRDRCRIKSPTKDAILSYDGSTVATVLDDKWIRTYDAATGELMHQFDTELIHFTDQIALSPYGKFLIYETYRTDGR